MNKYSKLEGGRIRLKKFGRKLGIYNNMDYSDVTRNNSKSKLNMTSYPAQLDLSSPKINFGNSCKSR